MALAADAGLRLLSAYKLLPFCEDMAHLCVCVSRPVTLTFDLFTLKLVCESHLRNLPSKFGHATPLSSRFICYVCDGRTDGQTGGQKQRLLPRYLWVGA